MMLKDYLNKKELNEAGSLEIYSSLINSVDTSINIINLILSSENENVKKLKKLEDAKSKLESAYSDIKKIPAEIIKNIVVDGWNSIKNKILTWT